MRFSRFLPLALLTILLPAPVASADVVIDSFQDRPGFGLPLAGGYLSGSALPTQTFAGVVGGRGMAVFGTTPVVHTPLDPPPNYVSADMDNSKGASILQFTADASGYLLLAYGGNVDAGGGAPRPLALSVNSSACSLRLTFSSYDASAGEDLIISAFFQTQLDQLWFQDPLPGTPDYTTLLTTAGAQSVDIPLSGLADPTLDYVTFLFEAPERTSFQLDSVTFVSDVPEPGAILLFLPALALAISRKIRLN